MNPKDAAGALKTPGAEPHRGRPHSASVPNGRVTGGYVVKQLVADGLLSASDAERFKQSGGRERAGHPLTVLAEMNYRSPQADRQLLDLETLTQWLAGKASLPYFHIDPLRVDFTRVVDVMSSSYASTYSILPVAMTATEVTIATCEPFQTGWEREIEQITKKTVKRVVANPIDVARYTTEFYKLAQQVKGAARTGSTPLVSSFEQLVELGGKVEANDAHVIHIVDWLLQYAFDQRASDIHIEPRRDQGHIRFRIDGVLHNVYEMPVTVMVAVTSRLKALGRMDVVEKRRPQDGRIKTKTPSGSEIELRLSTMPTAFGEKMVLRIFDPEVLVRSFSDLGFGKDDRARWQEMVGHVNGIVLVTGPTGSGKTTTLYSTLKQLARPEINVCSVEDPIEMVEDSFNQMQVQAGIGVTFASGIRTLLRQDPDVIMVGEIRDRETAEMAIQAALTGHLVLSTLHTNDAPSAITRLLELGVAPHMVRATLLGVLAQRLVRTLCPSCRRPAELDDADWEALVAPWKVAKPAQVHAADGCIECRRTGFRGRIGIYESLLVTQELRRHITSASDLADLRQACYREGMHPLRLAGARKVAAGLTTVEEVLNVAPGADD